MTCSTRIDDLDLEVREDVQTAAELLALEEGLPLMPPDDSTASRVQPQITVEQFTALMERALKLRRGPRSYLVPSPSSKSVSQPSFRPAINPRSRGLAARLRPPEISTFEILHNQANQVRLAWL
jgi:hypothetical protein